MTPLQLALHRAEQPDQVETWGPLFIAAAFRDAGCPLPADLRSAHPGEWTKYAIQHDQAVTGNGVVQPGDIAITSRRRWSMRGGLPIINDGSELDGRVPGDSAGLVVSVASDSTGVELLVVEGGMIQQVPYPIGSVVVFWRPPAPLAGGELPPEPGPITPVVLGPDGNPTFRLGNYDQRIVALTRTLRDLGANVPEGAYYGAAVVQVISAMQEKYGLAVTGSMTPETWTTLSSLVTYGTPTPPPPPPTPTNAPTAPPAAMSPSEASAAGIEPDDFDDVGPPPIGTGVPSTDVPESTKPATPPTPEPEPTPEPAPQPDLGPPTAPVLTPGGKPFLVLGNVDQSIRWLIDNLNAVGELAAPLDPGDIYTFDVARAVQGFQSRHGLPDTGSMDDATWDALAQLILSQPIEAPTLEQRVDALERRVAELETP